MRKVFQRILQYVRGWGLRHLVLTAVTLLLILLVAFPLALLLWNSFRFDGQLSVQHYADVFSESRNFRPFINTIKLGGLTVLTSAIIALPTAYLVARTDLPLKGLIETLLIVPYMIPPFLGAMAWIHLMAPRVGYLNRAWMHVFGGMGGPFNIYGLWGIVWVMTLHNYPFMYFTARSALERMDPALEESARICGAGRLRVARGITLPLIAPALGAGALLVFLYTVANFGIPALIGMQARFYVLTTRIYGYIYTGNFSGIKQAAALSAVLIAVAGVAVVLNRLLLGRKEFTVVTGKGARPPRVRLGFWKAPILGLLAIFFAIIVLLPVLSILSSALLKAWGLPLSAHNVSLDNLRYVLFEYDLTRTALKTSFLLALSAATATTIIGTLVAYLQVRTQFRGRHAMEWLATLPYAIPGTVIALAMILAWSGAFAINLYNTFWIILVAYVARYVTFPFRNVGAMLRQVHPSLEEAATACGAGWLRRFRDVIIPLIKPGLIASWFLVFIPTLRELTISILLWGPKTPTVGVAIFEMQDAGDYSSAAALGSVILIIVVSANLLLRKLLNVRFRI